MGFWRRLFGIENRAEAVQTEKTDTLLEAIFGETSEITRETALQIPTISGGVDLIGNIIAGTPIKLFREVDGKAEEIKDDPRVRILNDETGDTLNANEFWRAITRDYFLGKGGYAYIEKRRGKFAALYYVDEKDIAFQKNSDPIHKDFKVLVNGQSYEPYSFLRILRNTRDGAEGTPITRENSKLIEAAYANIVLERNIAKRGGNKRGYLKSPRRLTQEAIDTLRNAFGRLYSNSESAGDSFVVLNEGVDFQEATNTSVEMQMNETKITNANEFARIFHIPADVISGKATAADTASLAKLAAIPLMVTIQCALNSCFLLEREKQEFYFAFDTKELLKGDMQSRFAAYKDALDANFMQIDEVRYAEDMEPLGLNWIKLGLKDVLYDPKTKSVYTPNTNQVSNMQIGAMPEGGETNEN